MARDTMGVIHWRFIAAFIVCVAGLFYGLCDAQLVTHPDDLALYEALIINNPDSWGQMKDWKLGNDPCTLGDSDAPQPVAGLTCEKVGSFMRVVSLDRSGLGMPFESRLLSGPIPPQVGEFAYLQRITMRQNKHTGPLPDFASRQLHTIDFSSNNLSGPIPESYFEQPRLATLSLSQNMLTGSLPDMMLGAPTHVQLYSNQLSGTITFQFNKTRLNLLHLNSNKFSGPLPDDFVEDAPLLMYLNLQDNAFSGSLPSSIGKLPSLTHLDISRNKFSGTIPEFEGTELWTVSMWRNRLTGSIPNSLQKSRRLSSLVLSCNRLTGPIPEFLGNMPSLQVLRLEVNNLAGNLPKFLQAPPIIGGEDEGGSGATDLGKLVFNATCNDFYGPLPLWCGASGKQTCIPCADELRNCKNDFVIANPITLSPSPSPPESDSAASSSLFSRSLLAYLYTFFASEI